jgi:hypothetical protein
MITPTLMEAAVIDPALISALAALVSALAALVWSLRRKR